MLFKDKVCIVTGGAQGIGKATSFAFAEEGAEVAIFDLNALEAEETSRNISVSTGRKVLAVSGDVTKKKDVERLVQKTIKKFGKIDVLVNNAGIWKGSTLVEMNEEDWDAVFAVNVKGVFLCSQAAAKEMIKRRSGKIINIASMAGEGSGVEGWSAYCASKAAVIMLTKVFAQELKPFGITVNALCPSATNTTLLQTIISAEGGDYGYAAKPEDIAKAVALLASDLAGGITGKAFDGPPEVRVESLRKIVQRQSHAFP